MTGGPHKSRPNESSRTDRIWKCGVKKKSDNLAIYEVHLYPNLVRKTTAFDP